MNFVYEDLLDAIENVKTYLLIYGQTCYENTYQILEKLNTIRRGICSLNQDTFLQNSSVYDSLISDFISIKYSKDYINIVNLVENKNTSNTLKLTSNR